MGLLTEQRDENNILTENGFEHKGGNVTGQLDDCYEKCIGVGTYYAWIAVNTETGHVCIYVEYDCGGEVATYTHSLRNSWDDDPDDFFEELDDFATSMLEHYTY